MTVVSAQPLSSVMANKGGKGGRVYTSKYRVITNDKYDNAVTINLSVLLPAFGATYAWGTAFDLGAFAQWPHACQLERGDDQAFRKVWIVTVIHETPDDGDQRGDQRGDDPTAYPWEVNGDADEWTEEAQKDQDDKPIVSSSLEPFRGKNVQVFRNREKLSLSKNFATLNLSLIRETRGSVNASAVTILGQSYPARQLYMRRLRWSRVVYAAGNRFYFTHSFEIDTNPDTFDLKLVDQGHRQLIVGALNTDPQNFTPIIDRQTQRPCQHPMNLDGNGHVLQAGQPVVIKSFKYYKQRPWSAWNFPT